MNILYKHQVNIREYILVYTIHNSEFYVIADDVVVVIPVRLVSSRVSPSRATIGESTLAASRLYRRVARNVRLGNMQGRGRALFGLW